MRPRRSITMLLMVAAVTGAGAMATPPSPTHGEFVIAWRSRSLPPGSTRPRPCQITPFAILYALHDALVRPSPGERMGNSLAGLCLKSRFCTRFMTFFTYKTVNL